MTSADTEILTVEDLAELFACDKETAAARLKCGDLPGVKVGRGWIIPRQALFERLNEMAREEAAARRAQLEATRNTAERRGKAAQEALHAKKVDSPQVLLPTTTLKQGGRRRRIPPPLPSLSI
ncbi:helix-turn-helix domain-containing protein [Delftia acidovorans]|uniref:helix-turn-helix domain-containing protein n=1 Tax=Delftia acidovorans TaxID=80866 RepID=UPI00241C2238|nr:helix-turn-helix domain-containing protein [Delftia acidovorans]